MTLFFNGRHAQGFGLPKSGWRYSLLSTPREFSSLRITRLIQAETEASPSFANASCMPFSSCGSTLSDICLLPLDLMVVDTCQTPSYPDFAGQVYVTRQSKTTKPDSAVTLIGPLTTNVKRLTNMAINKFTFLLAQGKQYIAELHEIRLVTVLADTEQEARALAGAYPLVFVGRCPAQGVAA